MKIYNLVVTYNRAEMLDGTLMSLKRNGFENLIVVNNASTDNTEDVINKSAKDFMNFHYIKSDVNTGGAGGFQLAMHNFLKLADVCDYALIHDDDSWPCFDSHVLYNFLGGNKILHGCFPVVHPEGDLNSMNIPGKSDLLKNPWPYFFSSQNRAKRRPVDISDFSNFKEFDYCGFVGYLINYKAMMKVGLPSAKFFIYSDDTTYTHLAVEKLGKLSNLSVNGMSFIHDCKRSTGRMLLNSRFASYEIRNKVIFLRISSPRYYWLLVTFFLFKCIIQAPTSTHNIFVNVFKGLWANLDEYLPLRSGDVNG